MCRERDSRLEDETMSAMNAGTSAVVESVVAKIESGALGAGYSVRVEDECEWLCRIHVTRYGRQRRGYIEVNHAAIDLSGLDIAGKSESTLRGILTA